jgi:hypothetical protein
MKLAEIKKLIETQSITQLQQAEAQLLEGEELDIAVGGDDAGEQLTHVMAALEVLKDMQENGTEVSVAMRTYTKRVRDSIS